MEMSEEVGLKVKLLRTRRRLDQGEVAARLGITGSALSHIEAGRAVLALPHLLALVDVLQCSVLDLLPDSVVRQTDRERARDARLQRIIDCWSVLTEPQRDFLTRSAEFAACQLEPERQGEHG